MRRTLPLVLTAVLALAACGSDGDGAATDGSTVDTTSPTATVDTDGSTPDGTAGNPDKPTVEFPGTDVTELEVTVLEEGTGPEAAEGDTVVVDYVGVRSTDGVEFDNSYDRGEPFDVVLGSGSVIAGWEQGLVGAQAGSRIQVDIPSDLAYGAEARDDIIGADEDLTFVIDVRAVIPPAVVEDQPTEPGVDPSEGATEVSTVDLVEGEGEEAQRGQTALVRYVLFRGDNGVLLESSWEGSALPITLDDSTFPVLADGIEGMQVGGRRAITFPPQYPDFGFGPEGRPTAGLPAETDVVIVVDLVGLYGDPS
jgi:peptidylprolyl isomerase